MSNSTFFEKSKEIANKFIQNILFIDDEIYPDKEGKNNLDGKKILKSFSQAKKLCALNNPTKKSEFEDVMKIAQLSDITILDWRLNLEEDESDGSDDAESISESIDTRGEYTLELIENILKTRDNELNLILIYTGETGLLQIVENIYKRLELYGINRIGCIDTNILGKANFKIIVKAKPSLKGTFTHTPELNKWILDYEDIPDFLLTEFTKMTEGLLSNFILSSLSLIRQSTFKLINLYNKELDQAYFLHKLLLPNPNDSLEQLIEITTHSIQSTLNYSNDNEGIIPEDLIFEWIKENQFSFTPKICKKDITIDSDFLIDWIKLGYNEKIKQYWSEKGYDLNKLKKLDSDLSSLAKEGSKILGKPSENRDNDADFSILTHHKSNIKHQSQQPRLTLGSVVYKIIKKGNENPKERKEYYLCLQAKCDSVRVKEKQRFIFLQLEERNENGTFNFISKDDKNQLLKLRYKSKSYDIKTFKFDPTKDKDIVLATRDHETSPYYFTTIWDEKLFWLFDLKDLHSHRIANIFASQLARVGLDESEWLRRLAN